MPRRRSGAVSATFSAVFAPSEVPITTASSISQVVHQRDDLLAEEAHRVAPHVARAVRFAVAEQVDRDHAVAARRQVFGQRRCISWESSRPWTRISGRPSARAARRAARRARLGDRRRAAAVLGVRDALTLELEAGHVSTLLPGQAAARNWSAGQQPRARRAASPPPDQQTRRKTMAKQPRILAGQDRRDHRRRPRDRARDRRRRCSRQGMKVAIGDVDLDAGRADRRRARHRAPSRCRST